MKKILFTIFSFLSSFILICDVNAVSNINDFSHLTIADSGAIYNNSNDSGYNSVGYIIDEASFGTGSTGQPYSFVTTTSNLQTVLNGYGASISQCGFSFQQGHNYSLTFYFMSDEYNDIKYSLGYTRKTNKLGISNSPTGSTSFNALSSESGVNNYVNKPYYVSWYSIVFKAPSSGSCITSAFSTSPTYTHTTSGNMFMYLGYFYDYLGEGNLTADEIQNALENSFNNVTNNINSSINSATNSINSNIDNATGQINSNIDSMKDKQDETNTKLDEQNETSKGIWGTIKEGLSNIGKWFTDLGESIGNFFAELIDALKTGFDFVVNKIVGLFVGEEEKECIQLTNWFNGYQYYGRSIPSTPNTNIKPDSDGWFTISTGGDTVYASELIPALEPDTEYTIILETGDTVSGSFAFNQVIKGRSQFAKSDGFRLEKNTRNIFYQKTVSDFTGINYAYISNGYGGSPNVRLRIMVLKGHWTEESLKENDITYFQGHKDVCTVVGSSTGLFGMITNLGESIGNWFAELTSSIGNFFTELLDGIIEGLKSLFIPEDGYFSDYFSSLYDFFNDKLGILIYPIDLLLEIFNRFVNISVGSGLIHIPDISIGEFGVLIEGRDFYLDEYWSQEPYATIYKTYRVFVTGFVGLCLIKLAYKKEKEIVGGSTE